MGVEIKYSGDYDEADIIAHDAFGGSKIFKHDNYRAAKQYHEEQMLIQKQRELTDLQLENEKKKAEEFKFKNTEFNPIKEPIKMQDLDRLLNPIIFKSIRNNGSELPVTVKHNHIEKMNSAELESYIIALEMELSRVEEHIKSKSK